MAEKSRMTREWIERVWKDNPCVLLPNGEIRTGPVRLAFANLLERGKPGPDGKERAYGAVLLFPPLDIPGVDLSVIKEAERRLLQEKAPGALTNPDLRAKFHMPIKRQDTYLDKKTGELYDGFVAGRAALSCNSMQTQPPVVDQNGAPITNKARVYSGCWAICAINPGWITNALNPGPTFYMQTVMVVADDDSLGGVGAANPSVSFAGVKIDQTVNPAALFDASGAGAAETDLFS